MKRYDKSQIMKNAWYLYLHSWNITFSEALKYAWKKAKQEAARKEREEKELETAKENRSAFSKRNYRMYKNVQFGRNDWAMDYGRKYKNIF